MTIGLKALSRACGLSTSTVSNILSRRGRHAEATCRRVRDLARKHGYTPSRLASSLSRRTSSAVAILATDLTHPFYAELLDALTRALYKIDLEVMVGVAPWENEAEVGRLYKSFLSWRPRAFLIITFGDVVPSLSEEDIAQARKSSVVITVNRKIWPECPAVVPDRQKIHRLAVEYLVGLGHRRIGFLNSDPGFDNYRAKMLREELARKKLVLRAEDIFCRPLSANAGEAVAEKWRRLGMDFARLPDRPTALVARSEPVAGWFLGGLMSAGGRVPEDVSVVVTNNTRAAGLSPVPLTAVGVPTDIVADATIKLLQDALSAKEKNRPFNRPVCLDPQLRARRSTGRPG